MDTPVSGNKKPRKSLRLRDFSVGWIVGLEPTASRATIWRASQLRHTHHIVLPDCFATASPLRDGIPRFARDRDLLVSLANNDLLCTKLLRSFARLLRNRVAASRRHPSLRSGPRFYFVKSRHVPEGIRTPDPRLRRPLLYPTELRTRALLSQPNRHFRYDCKEKSG